jgi:hypothetical protein
METPRLLKYLHRVVPAMSEDKSEIERMIGRRVENMKGVYILGFALCWAATAGGVYVGVTVYPWAYPLPSGLYALY